MCDGREGNTQKQALFGLWENTCSAEVYTTVPENCSWARLVISLGLQGCLGPRPSPVLRGSDMSRAGGLPGCDPGEIPWGLWGPGPACWPVGGALLTGHPRGRLSRSRTEWPHRTERDQSCHPPTLLHEGPSSAWRRWDCGVTSSELLNYLKKIPDQFIDLCFLGPQLGCPSDGPGGA